MSGVRPLRRADLPAVAGLFDENARDGGTRPPSPVVDHLERTLLRPPFHDPGTPSLVYEDATGAVLGTVAVRGCPMVLDGAPVRAVSIGGFVVRRAARGTGVGRRLLATALGGPQDLSVCDTANAATRAVWLTSSGRELAHACFEWRHVIRPARAAVVAPRVARRGPAVRRTAALLAGPVDAVLAARRRTPASSAAATVTPLSADDVVAGIAGLGSLRLRPDHDPSQLRRVFDELDSEQTPGRSLRALVRGSDGELAGWYLVHLTPSGVAEVLQIAGPEPGTVLGRLLADAARAGAIEVRGRVQPDLLVPLREHGCSMRPGPWMLVDSPLPELRALLASPSSLFSRLEGDWWNGYLQWCRGPSGERHRTEPAGSDVSTNGPHGAGTRAKSAWTPT